MKIKILKYDFWGKVKYDVIPFIISLIFLVLGAFLGIAFSPWLLIICIFSPFAAFLYQAEILFEIANTKVLFHEKYFELNYSKNDQVKIKYAELNSLTINLKKDFAQLQSFPISVKTFTNEYKLLFCGVEGDKKAIKFINTIYSKKQCKINDKANIIHLVS